MFTVHDLKPGTVFTNGKKRKRIVLGLNGFFVYYKTSLTSKTTTGELISSFLKWAKAKENV